MERNVMEPTNDQIIQLKQIELNMFKAFIDVCEKLELKYYVIGGTLLGAIRHQGFIPWDDDIDVGMPRSDYEIFLEKGQAILEDDMFIQTIHTDEKYLMCFAKIRKHNTTFIESSVGHLDINHGVYIDIFPLDYYPNEKQLKKFKKQELWCKKRIACEFKLSKNNTLKKRIEKFILRMLFPSVKAVTHKRDYLYKSLPQNKYIANYGGAWGEKEVVPAVWFGEGVDVSFEGISVKAPREYDKYLTQLYGNYMEFPPIEKRVSHHYVDVIDLEKSYLNYR